jgi:hypothetical protein
MPDYTYSDLINTIDENLHNKIGVLSNQRRFVNRIVRETNNEVDIEDTIRRTPLSPLLFSSIFDYTQPTDVKSNKYVDIRRILLNNGAPKFHWFAPERFERLKGSRNDIFCVENRDTTRVLRISGDGKITTVVDEMDSDDNWAVHGDATTLVEDSQRFYSGNGSLRFTLPAAGTAGGVTGNITAVDLSAFKNRGSLFLGVYLPAAANVTSVGLRWGSSATDYYEVVATAPSVGSFQDGFNILRFNWSSITPTGSPTDTAIDYFRVNIIYNGTLSTEYGVDFLAAAQGYDHDLIYYSNKYWRTSAGVWIEQSTVASDILNVDDDAFDLYVCKGTYKGAAILREKEDYVTYKSEFYDKRLLYMQKHPSKAKTMEQQYIDMDDLDAPTGGFSDTIVHSR